MGVFFRSYAVFEALCLVTMVVSCLACDLFAAVVGLEHDLFRVSLAHLKPLPPIESLGRVGDQNAQPEGNAGVLGLCDYLPEDDRAHPLSLEAWKQVKLVEPKMVHMTRGLDASGIETVADDDPMPVRDEAFWWVRAPFAPEGNGVGSHANLREVSSELLVGVLDLAEDYAGCSHRVIRAPKLSGGECHGVRIGSLGGSSRAAW